MSLLGKPAFNTMIRTLRAERNYLREHEIDETEVRLQIQIYPKCEDLITWAIHTGSSDYDQDHRGYWGASILGASDTNENIDAMAKDLLDQCEEAKANE